MNPVHEWSRHCRSDFIHESNTRFLPFSAMASLPFILLLPFSWYLASGVITLDRLDAKACNAYEKIIEDVVPKLPEAKSLYEIIWDAKAKYPILQNPIGSKDTIANGEHVPTHITQETCQEYKDIVEEILTKWATLADASSRFDKREDVNQAINEGKPPALAESLVKKHPAMLCKFLEHGEQAERIRGQYCKEKGVSAGKKSAKIHSQ